MYTGQQVDMLTYKDLKKVEKLAGKQIKWVIC